MVLKTLILLGRIEDVSRFNVQSLKLKVNVWVELSKYVIVAVPEEGPLLAAPKIPNVFPPGITGITCPAAAKLSLLPFCIVGSWKTIPFTIVVPPELNPTPFSALSE